MSRAILILSVLAVVIVPASVFSQERKPSSRYQEILKRFDKNKDGKLDAKEREEIHKSIRARMSQQRPQGPVCNCTCGCCKADVGNRSRGRFSSSRSRGSRFQYRGGHRHSSRRGSGR